MFDFEKLEVYQKAKIFNAGVYSFLQSNRQLDTVAKNQLRRASFSIVLNIAEGSSRFSKADRKNFYVISRGSIFECVAICDILKEEAILKIEEFGTFYSKAEELSKMLFAMIQKLDKPETKIKQRQIFEILRSDYNRNLTQSNIQPGSERVFNE